MSSITFRLGSPEHCDKTLRFGVLTSCCPECGARFDTVDVTLAGMMARGREPDELAAMLGIATIGAQTRAPLHAQPDQPRAEKPPSLSAELAAQKVATEAIGKAMGK